MCLHLSRHITRASNWPLGQQYHPTPPDHNLPSLYNGSTYTYPTTSVLVTTPAFSIPVYHNYGHGGEGFILAHTSALKILDLLAASFPELDRATGLTATE